jgi:hypothetical protein
LNAVVFLRLEETKMAETNQQQVEKKRARPARFAEMEAYGAEWREAWKKLASVTGDDDCAAEDPLMHEVWRYTGSLQVRGEKRWLHEFLHRHHPRTQQSWRLRLPASDGWAPRGEPTRWA